MSCTIARPSTSADEEAIDGLIREAGRLALRIPWQGFQRAQATHAFFLVEDRGGIEVVIALLLGPGAVAHTHVFALHSGWEVGEALSRLLPLVRERLESQGVETWAFVGPEAWLLEALVDKGFRQVNTIITLEKTDWSIPEVGSDEIVVRPALYADLQALLRVDSVAFDPLWWNTADTLAEWLADASFFVVAESDGQVVGYACASLSGRHAHLSRIAVHPEHHRQGIGMRLLAEAIAFFRRRQAFGLTLNTQQDNDRGRRLYERFGFRLLGEEAKVLVMDV